VPPVVFVAWVRCAPHAPVRRAAILLWRVAAAACAERFHDLLLDLNELVQDRERDFERQHARHVVRCIERPEQHLALDIGEAQREAVVGRAPRAGLAVLEPVHPLVIVVSRSCGAVFRTITARTRRMPSIGLGRCSDAMYTSLKKLPVVLPEPTGPMIQSEKSCAGLKCLMNALAVNGGL
jgi:hypothetical protein